MGRNACRGDFGPVCFLDELLEACALHGIALVNDDCNGSGARCAILLGPQEIGLANKEGDATCSGVDERVIRLATFGSANVDDVGGSEATLLACEAASSGLSSEASSACKTLIRFVVDFLIDPFSFKSTLSDVEPTRRFEENQHPCSRSTIPWRTAPQAGRHAVACILAA